MNAYPLIQNRRRRNSLIPLNTTVITNTLPITMIHARKGPRKKIPDPCSAFLESWRLRLVPMNFRTHVLLKWSKLQNRAFYVTNKNYRMTLPYVVLRQIVITKMKSQNHTHQSDIYKNTIEQSRKTAISSLTNSSLQTRRKLVVGNFAIIHSSRKIQYKQIMNNCESVLCTWDFKLKAVDLPKWSRQPEQKASHAQYYSFSVTTMTKNPTSLRWRVCDGEFATVSLRWQVCDNKFAMVNLLMMSLVFLSKGNTVYAQFEKVILVVRNYNDEMSGHQIGKAAVVSVEIRTWKSSKNLFPQNQIYNLCHIGAVSAYAAV